MKFNFFLYVYNLPFQFHAQFQTNQFGKIIYIIIIDLNFHVDIGFIFIFQISFEKN